MSKQMVIFDTDGTLMDGRLAVIDAVAAGLAATYDHFQLPVPELDRERIGLAMGLPSSTFFRTAFDPDTVPAELRGPFARWFWGMAHTGHATAWREHTRSATRKQFERRSDKYAGCVFFLQPCGVFL